MFLPLGGRYHSPHPSGGSRSQWACRGWWRGRGRRSGPSRHWCTPRLPPHCWTPSCTPSPPSRSPPASSSAVCGNLAGQGGTRAIWEGNLVQFRGKVFIIPRFSSESQRVVEFSFLSQTESWTGVEEAVGGGGASQGAGDGQEERGDEEEVHLSAVSREWGLRTRTELSRGTTITVTLGQHNNVNTASYNSKEENRHFYQQNSQSVLSTFTLHIIKLILENKNATALLKYLKYWKGQTDILYWRIN